MLHPLRSLSPLLQAKTRLNNGRKCATYAQQTISMESRQRRGANPLDTRASDACPHTHLADAGSLGAFLTGGFKRKSSCSLMSSTTRTTPCTPGTRRTISVARAASAPVSKPIT